MVWALIFSLALLAPLPALAEPDSPPAGTEVVPDSSTPPVSPLDDSSGPVQVEVVNLPDSSLEDSSSEGPLQLWDSDGNLVATDSVADVSTGDAARALTSSVYSSVTSLSGYPELAASVFANKSSWGDDYVFYRSGQYEYVLAYGEIGLSGQRFSGSSVSFVRFYQSADRSGYLFDAGTSSLSVDAGSYVVLSSLGGYPALDSGSLLVARTALFLLVVAALFGLIWGIVRLGYVVVSHEG